MSAIAKGLIVREPYASMIVKGVKKWEIRSQRTKIRGQIAIVSKKRILGSVELVGVKGPFSVDELMRYYPYHKADRETLNKISRGKPLYAWRLDNPVEFKEPITINIPPGPVIWVDIKPHMILDKQKLVYLLKVFKT
ncbi:MAG: ASCH domain-containing protein [Candidatus Njordarchaeales archaeon]